MLKMASISEWNRRNLKVPTWSDIIKKSGETPNKKKEVNYESIRCIGSKHCIGEYVVLSYGDGRTSYAERCPDGRSRSFVTKGISGFLR